jgi:hypothetical protein
MNIGWHTGVFAARTDSSPRPRDRFPPLRRGRVRSGGQARRTPLNRHRTSLPQPAQRACVLITKRSMIDLLGCPACGAPAAHAREIIRKDVQHGGGPPLTERVIVCSCGHAFITPQPTRAELAPFYQMNYHVFVCRAPDTASVDRLLATKHRGDRPNHALVVSGGKCLDVGCGLGEMLAGIARLGREAEGIEPGRSAVDQARKLGLKVIVLVCDNGRFPTTKAVFWSATTAGFPPRRPCRRGWPSTAVRSRCSGCRDIDKASTSSNAFSVISNERSWLTCSVAASMSQ